MPYGDYQGLPIDRGLGPFQLGEIIGLSDALIWKATNEETSQPFAASAVGGVSLNGLLLFGFGVVSRGPSADGVGYPTAITDVFQGIILQADIFEQRVGYTLDSAGRSGYPVRASGTPGQATNVGAGGVSLIRRAGRIGVPIETAVAANDPVHMRCVIGTGVARGAFRNSADGTAPALTMPIPRARFLTNVAAPAANTLGIGIISLDGVC